MFLQICSNVNACEVVVIKLLVAVFRNNEIKAACQIIADGEPDTEWPRSVRLEKKRISYHKPQVVFFMSAGKPERVKCMFILG